MFNVENLSSLDGPSRHSSLEAGGLEGVHAVMTVNGATDAEVLQTSAKRVLGPTLTPSDIVVMEHVSAHKAAGIQQDFARRRARLRYWPPSSPGVSPVERGVSQRNTALGVAKACMRAALDMEL
jgi:hypothetical protein